MIRWIINSLIIAGSALMIVNIIGFVKYALFVKGRQKWNKGRGILYVPIVLLCLFFIGYMSVWIFGSPDMIMAGILFGGSIFVFIMMILLNRITRTIIESEQLEARLMAAEEGNRLKNEFMASISHEMRTPLNVILGLDELAQKSSGIPPETRMQLINIERSGKHLLGLINNILEMQDMDGKARKPRNEAFFLHDVTDQINAMAGMLCEEKGLIYKTEIGEDVPDGLLGDEMMLKKVLMNLLDNAVKYTSPPGTVILRAETESSAEDSCVLRFTVKDTGIGISEEFLPKVFDLFSQEDTSFTNRYGGSGMGLAVTKQKTEQMNGRIGVSSRQGAGSEFTVTVPFELSEAVTAPEKEPAGSADEEVSLAGRRILIAEDVDENAEIAADLLELEDALSERAKDGSEALEMFRSSPPGCYDAILMDLRMPVMDGLESARSIRSLDREDAKTVPIIALTANAFEEDIRNSAEAGMNAHLVKPIDSELLYRTLSRLIGAYNKSDK